MVLTKKILMPSSKWARHFYVKSLLQKALVRTIMNDIIPGEICHWFPLYQVPHWFQSDLSKEVITDN